MEIIKNQTAIFSKVLRIVYLGLLLFHLLLWSLNVKGQTSLRPGFPRCAYPPLAGAGGGSAPSSTQDLVRKIYTSQIGISETQPNSGPEVEKYLRYVNLPKGNPWCAAFVCWVFGEGGIDNPRTGWSPSLFAGNRVIWTSIASPVSRIKNQPACRLGRESRFVGSSPNAFRNNGVDGINLPSRSASPPSLVTGNWQLATPYTGDVFGLFFPEKGRIAHVGFVDQWQDPWVTTVEGNTNVLGSREGDGVYRKRRLVRSIYKVARYLN